MLIYKEKLPMDTLDIRAVELPYDSAKEARQAVLRVGLQYGEPCMWYDAIEYDLPTKKYLILAVGTGHYWENKLTRDMYIGTVLLEGGSLVLHYFLVDSDILNLPL